MVLVLPVSLLLAGWLAGREGSLWLVFFVITATLLYLLGVWLRQLVITSRQGGRKFVINLAGFFGLVIGFACYLYFSIWLLRPDLLPQHSYYDLIANRQVTERLVDPALFKAENWDINGEKKPVLFVHPAASGRTTLVYPVKIEPQSWFRAVLALAPDAWTMEGDGVVFNIYIEDNSGIHLVFSQYLDPKHHEQDRRWLPISVNLNEFNGKLVRLILEVNSGPAGDQRYDWAGWGIPRLERPFWP